MTKDQLEKVQRVIKITEEFRTNPDAIQEEISAHYHALNVLSEKLEHDPKDVKLVSQMYIASHALYEALQRFLALSSTKH